MASPGRANAIEPRGGAGLAWTALMGPAFLSRVREVGYLRLIPPDASCAVTSVGSPHRVGQHRRSPRDGSSGRTVRSGCEWPQA
ncbi:MAG: hypothetical protein QOE51_175 [Actinoplanes sp.]|nr:hypothetical protein [Actinoplanes sp.]